ncbi:MAG TPA: hypothetical protein VN788_00395 [Verrucomicrobiae bacterium]|nr:hypothetical protein [Verrucomicrobiae bacterium]
MGTFERKDVSGTPPGRREEPPPSPRVLKLALIAAAIILLIGVLLYLKARHAPPALHDELLPGARMANGVHGG